MPKEVEETVQTAEEPVQESAPVQPQGKTLGERLIEAGVPKEVVTEAVPAWKAEHGKVQVAWLGSGAYIYRRLLWMDVKAINTTMTNLSRSDNATPASLQMLQLELQLEKAVLFPKITPQNSFQFPAGDLEALQEAISEFSGYSMMPPAVEEL